MKSRHYVVAVLLLITASTTSLPGFAQTQYQYGYDSSGNRISRQVITLRSASDAASDNKEEAIYESTLGASELKIYPNPTKGTLIVAFSSAEQQDQIYLRIYNMKGVLISYQLSSESKTIIDLSAQPSGTYIMKISSGESVSEWKIIKQ
jgi:hypothetical protein